MTAAWFLTGLGLVAVAARPTEVAMKGDGGQVHHWDGSRAFREYKDFYAAATKPRSLDEMHEFDDRMMRWSASLYRDLPQALATELLRVLKERRAVRWAEIQPRHGRLPRPRPGEDGALLGKEVERVEHQYLAYRAMRDAGGRDPWIEAVFRRDLEAALEEAGRSAELARGGDALDKKASKAARSKLDGIRDGLAALPPR